MPYSTEVSPSDDVTLTAPSVTPKRVSIPLPPMTHSLPSPAIKYIVADAPEQRIHASTAGNDAISPLAIVGVIARPKINNLSKSVTREIVTLRNRCNTIKLNVISFLKARGR